MALKLNDITNKGPKGPVGPAGSGPKGDAGSNGISPTISTSKSGLVTTLTITDVNGTKTATINDGEDYPVLYQLTGLETGNIIKKDGHYSLTLSANTTIHAEAGINNCTADAELFVNPVSYTLTAGNNLIFTNALTANKTNHCIIKWCGITARLTVVDSF